MDSKSLKGAYRLPEHGEPELVFTHPGGVDALMVRQCGEITRYIYSAKAHRGSLEELKTICQCGRRALFNGCTVDGKFVFDGDQVAIDGVAVGYESLCPACYLEESGGKLYQ